MSSRLSMLKGTRKAHLTDALFSRSWQYSYLTIILSILLLLGVCLSAFPTQSSALEVDKTTARPNSSSSEVVAGLPTRITWEAVTEGSVSEVTLNFPEDTNLEELSVRPTILEGLKRIDANPEVKVNDTNVTLLFSDPVPADSRLRIEFEGVVFGDNPVVEIDGSYKLADNSKGEFDAVASISVTTVSTTDKIIHWLDQQPAVEYWNSNTFLSTFFKPQLIAESVPILFWGWLRVLALVAIGFPLAIPIGLMFAFLKIGRNRILRGLASIYINVIRGTPLFLQIYIAFFGLPLLNINIDNFILGFCVMAINSGAYLAEIFRAGIQSIDKGQFEAAASLGMNRWKSMFYVIIPQTVRRVIPTMTSEFITLYKDTSLLSSVGVMELMMYSKNLTATTGNITPYIVAAGFYLLVTLPLIRVVTILERKLAENESGKAPKKKSKKRFFHKSDKKNSNITDAESDRVLSEANHGSR